MAESPQLESQEIGGTHDSSEDSDVADDTNTTDILLFITSAEADYKLVNRLLLATGDIDAGPGADYRFHVLLHQDPTILGEEPFVTRPGDFDEVTFTNTWSGASVEQAEAFALQTAICQHSGLMLILDNKGAEEETVIVAERAMSTQTDDASNITVEPLNEFSKVRVPWWQAMPMAVNLWVANMDFLEFTATWDSGEESRGGWYDYRGLGKPTQQEEERRAREPALRRLQRKGLA